MYENRYKNQIIRSHTVALKRLTSVLVNPHREVRHAVKPTNHLIWFCNREVKHAVKPTNHLIACNENFSIKYDDKSWHAIKISQQYNSYE